MTPALPPPAPLPRRSGEVTLIGVIFLCLGLMWLVGAVFQGAFFAFLASLRPGGIPLDDVQRDPNVPVAIRFIAHYAKLFWVVNIAAAAFLSICSVGLLVRKNWGRISFLFFGALGLLYSLGSLVFTGLMIAFFRSQSPAGPAMDGIGPISFAATIVLVLVVVKCLLLGVFFGWVIFKLTRPTIRAEFS